LLAEVNHHRATRDFLHFPLYLVAGIAALEVGREREKVYVFGAEIHVFGAETCIFGAET